MSTQAVIIFKPLQTIKTQTKKTNIKINHLCQKSYVYALISPAEVPFVEY